MYQLDEKMLNKLENGREYRAMSLAATSEDQYVVEGYATVFDTPYLLYEAPGFKVYEMISANAFDDADMSDVIMQYDHAGRVFARTRNNTLTVTPDETGLKVRGDLGGTDIGRQLHQEIKGGYTDKMSFGFTVAEDRRESINDRETGVETITRVITKIKKLYDVSAVSIPANDATSISARRLADGVIEEFKAERLCKAEKIKKIKILTEV